MDKSSMDKSHPLPKYWLCTPWQYVLFHACCGGQAVQECMCCLGAVAAVSHVKAAQPRFRDSMTCTVRPTFLGSLQGAHQWHALVHACVVPSAGDCRRHGRVRPARCWLTHRHRWLTTSTTDRLFSPPAAHSRMARALKAGPRLALTKLQSRHVFGSTCRFLPILAILNSSGEHLKWGFVLQKHHAMWAALWMQRWCLRAWWRTWWCPWVPWSGPSATWSMNDGELGAEHG